MSEDPDRSPLPYSPIWLEFSTKYRGGERRHGYRKYHWDRVTGEIFDENYRLNTGHFMGVIADLAKTHHIPNILISKICKSLRERLPSVKLRQQQKEIFLGVMHEQLPWIERAEILALTRAL